VSGSDKWETAHFEHLPDWMRDNEHLRLGHRPHLPSVAACLGSVFRIHTETGNIWTHLLGFVAFAVATVVFYVRPLCATCRLLDMPLSEKLIFLCFFVGALACLACSTIFHTLSCHSQQLASVLSRMDYAGIALLTIGSTIPWVFYGFYCQFYAMLTYIVSISVLGVLTIVMTLWDKFHLPDFRTFRAVVFVSLGAFAAIPFVHYILRNGIRESFSDAPVVLTLLMFALYGTGAFLYAARIPERFVPGKCDIWFQSHQLFHLLVVAAAFVHFKGISEMALRLHRDAECYKHVQGYVY
jgi:adiponectin receptor